MKNMYLYKNLYPIHHKHSLFTSLKLQIFPKNKTLKSLKSNFS